MELAGIRALVAVSETGSIKAAAAHLTISRATLRRRIQALEQELGVALMRAGESRVSLTEAGRRCVHEGRMLVRQTDDLAALLRVEGTAPSGLLRIAAPIGSVGPEVGAGLRYFAARFPQVRFELWFTADPAAALLQGAELAILFDRYPLGDWKVSSLGVLGWRAYAHPMYLRTAGPVRDLDDLARHRLLHGTAVPLPPAAWPLRAGGTVPIEPWLTTTDLDVVRQAVLDGLGIGLVLDDAEDELEPVLPDHIGMEVTTWALTPPSGAQLPRVRAFIEAARAYLAD